MTIFFSLLQLAILIALFVCAQKSNQGWGLALRRERMLFDLFEAAVTMASTPNSLTHEQYELAFKAYTTELKRQEKKPRFWERVPSPGKAWA